MCLLLQKLGGSTAYEHAAPYTSHHAVAEMHAALAAVCGKRIMQRIKDSPFIGLMVDESLDIAVQKKLVLYCKIAYMGEARVEFGANIEVHDGKAETILEAITSFLTENKIKIDKISGLGTDGANVMVGRRSGVGVKIQQMNSRIVTTWCAAHRLALVVHWAAKGVEYLSTVQSTLISVYNFYQYSAVRYNRLKDLKKIMGAHVKRFKKPTQVRWLSLQDSVLAMISAWGCLVLALDQEAAAANSDGAAQAKGILRVVKTFRFISAVCMLADALEAICSCSRTFQSDVLDAAEMQDMLAATQLTLNALPDNPGRHTADLLTQLQHGEYQGIQMQADERDREQLKNLCQKLVTNVNEEIAKRFPNEDMEVSKDLAIVLDPQKLPLRNERLPEHGRDSLDRLMNRYGGPAFDMDVGEVRQSYLQFKFYLTRHRNKSLSEMCKQLLQRPDSFPAFAKLAGLSLTIPLTSVPCERGFSAQNRVHTALRSSLTTKSVNNKLLIWHDSKHETFAVDEKEVIEEACEIFKKEKNRKSGKTGM